LTVLFDATNGVARDPALSFDARTIWFGYRPSKKDYFHLWRMNADGGDARQMTDGPFYDYFPCPLPDGGLAFMSTRCKARFLCWRPQAFVLFRMEADGTGVQPLSFANLSEWTPTVLRDGQLLWMRSEYLDKGANFGHTLWAIRPDGAQPELVFGNNTDNCYANGREVPGTSEIICTLVSHGGDLNGPIALIDPRLGRSNTKAVTSLTPDVSPQYDMNFACKTVYSPSGKTFFDNLKKGAEQIEVSEAEVGCVMVNFRNQLSHDVFWPILNEAEFRNGAEPLFGAYPDSSLLGYEVQRQVTLKRDQIAAEVGLENVLNMFKDKKALPGFLAFCQTTAAKATVLGPVPASVSTLVLGTFSRWDIYSPIFQQINEALHERVH